MSKHTPGPWSVKGLPGYTYVVGGNPETPVCDCAMMRPASGTEWHEANAKLIAAAPELAEALREFVALNLAGHPPQIDVEAVMQVARAALAKAGVR